MFTRSIARLTFIFGICLTALMFIAAFITLPATASVARPQADLIVNPGESIQTAIDAANDGDTIIINAGDYTESLTLSKPVSLTGVNSDTTIIHAMPNQRVLTVTGATISNSVVISGLTFTGGEAGNGGGLYADRDVTLINMQFISNTAYSWPGGGGAYISAMATLTGSLFLSNTASNGGGVAVLGLASLVGCRFENNVANSVSGTGGGLYHTQGALAISNTVFDGNTAGGAYSDNSTFVTVINSQFEHNSTYSYGGGLWIYSSTPVVTITNTDFLSNTASAGGAGLTAGTSGLQIFGGRFENNRSAGTLGGGLYVMGSVDLITGTEFISNSAPVGGGLYAGVSTIMNARFERNTSTSNSGGGLVIAGIGTSAITNTVFVSNSAYCSTLPCYAGGGGINTINPIQLADVNLTGNTAATSGGGLYASDAVTLTNVEFISNTASNFGGGLYTNGLAAVTNSQFLHNSASSGGGAWAGGAVLTGGRFEGNISASGIGGGLSTGPLAMSGTQFISNTAMCGGGAFAISPVIINGGRFERNTSNDSGGALCLSTLTLTGTEFINNSAATKGGAIFYSYTDADPIRNGRIVNALFSQNSANAGGAALFVQAKDNIALLHATIIGTNPQLPSAIAISQGTLNVTDTLIANHVIGISNTGGTVTEDYNLYYGNLTNTVGVTMGAHSLIGDPHFVDPAHDDYHLAFGSLAIDHGVDAGVYTDLDGNVRPHGAGFDIGAYEFTGDTRYVATTGDDASNLCLDQLSPCSTVQHAIDVATENDEIRIASGTYTDVSVRPRNDITTTGVVTQVAYLSKTLTLRGGYTLTNWLTPDLSINPTILDAQAQGRVFYITGNISPALEGLHLTNGTGILSDNYCEPFICYIPGGAIYAMNATVELIDSTVDNSAGGFEGAAIFVADGQASLRHNVVMSNTAGGVTLFNSDGLVTDNRIISNTASNGGGILVLSSTATLLRNDILTNTAFYACGGGVCIAYGSTAVLNNNVIRGNTAIAYGGGGVEVFRAQAVLRNNLIEGNFVNSPMGSSSGGGVNVDATSRAELIENTIRHNVVSGNLWERGGGVNVDINSSVTMTGNLIENNAASQGGGLSVARLSTATLANNLFVNNVGDSEIHLVGGEARLLHNTLAGNASSTGLDVTSYQDQWTPLTFSTVALTNTLIASHTVGINVSQGNTLTLNSLLWHATPITVSQTGTATVFVQNEFYGDPRFVDPAHDDYHLALGSAAIDHGVDAGVYTDLDGNLRPHGAGFDIGAYEFAGGTRYVATTGDDASNVCLDQLSPCATIQHAIDVATDGEQVLIANGLYTQSTTLNKPVSLTGVNSDTTIIHAMPNQRVLTVTGATISNSVVISGLTFTGGNANYGGGIYSDTPLTVLSSRFISNSALYGGGLYIIGLASLSDVQFEGNTATDLGGAINARNGILDLTRAVFVRNTGSAVYSENSPATIADSRFEQNSGTIGGAIWMYYVGANITHTEFISNTATQYGGGGVVMINGSVVNSRFENNSAQDWGGGLYAMGTTLVTNTEFISNTSYDNGGGAYFGNVELYNSRFERNTSVEGGGGFFAFDTLVSNTNVVSNQAGCNSWGCGGGGAFAYNEATVINSRFENNVAKDGGNGGGLNANSAITITNSAFMSNTADVYAGGLFANHVVTLTNVDFISNSSLGSAGGAALSGPSAIVGGHFINNKALAANSTGGGLSTGHDTIISGTEFIGNSAILGGGVSTNYTATLYNARFEGNTAMCGGGAFAISPVEIIGGRFERNTSNDSGGALCLSTLTLTGTEFISNSAATKGGAIFYSYTDADPIRNGQIVNALFSQNSANAGGAALFVQAKDNIALLHATIIGTNLQLPSAIAISQGTLNVTDTLIANHAIGISNTGGLVTEDYNLFYGNVTNTVGVTNGAHSLVGDPRFVDPAHDDYHLAFDSAAIDQGVDAGVYTDLDANLRPHGAGFDIGAYEFTGGTRYVATTGDDASNLCLDHLSPCSTVQHAIDVATDGEQVLIASGLYTESTTLNKPVSLTGVNSDTTIIHAVAGQRVLTVTGATISNSVVISGLTFTGGDATYGGGLLTGSPVNLIGMRFISNTAVEGGGLYAGTTSAMLSNCHFENNVASGDYGGGIETPFGTLFITTSRFISNTSNNSGGAFHAYAATVFESQFERNSAVLGNGAILVGNLTLSNSQFINNQCLAPGCEAGAVGVWPDATLPRIMGTTFTGNTALGRAGALFVNGALAIAQSDFISNTASNFGGGLYTSGLATITDSQFLSNSAASGGGVWAGGAFLTGGRFEGNVSIGGIGGGLSSGTFTMSDTEFISNTAMCGGGAFAISPVEITGGRFERNTSNGSGGALCLSAATLTDTEFVSNTAATDGGGLYTSDTVTLTNVEFISNTAQQRGGGVFGSQVFISNTQFVDNHAGCTDWECGGGGLFATNSAAIVDTQFISNTALQTGGGAYISGTATLIDTDFISNTSFEGGGGLEATTADITRGAFERNTTSGHDFGYGAYGRGGGVEVFTLTLTDTQFISNTAIYGGGAATYISHLNGGRFERNHAALAGGGLLNGGYLSGTVFISNSTAGWGGGLFSASPNSDAWLLGVLFEGNHASSGGGGLASLDYSLHVTGTRFIRNSANGYGGGVAFGDHQAYLINNLFVGNTTTRDGAAVALPEVGEMEIVNATIDDPIGNPHAAILNIGSTLHLTNTIIVNHAVGLQGSDSVSNTLGETTEDYNLYYGNLTNTIGVTNGAHSLIGDPHFVDPAHGNYHLAFGSAAIDHGVDAGVYIDLDGNVRPSGFGFDIGAYEYQGTIHRAYLPIIRR